TLDSIRVLEALRTLRPSIRASFPGIAFMQKRRALSDAPSSSNNTNQTTLTWHRSPSPFPDAPALSWRFCWRNFSRLDRFRFSPPFRTPPDLFHGPSPSHPCNPCLTSTFPLPSPPATRRFPPWQSLSNLHSPCRGPSPSAHRTFSLRCSSRSFLPPGPSPLPSFRLWPHQIGRASCRE